MGDGAEFDAIRRLLAVWGADARGIGDDGAVLAIPAGEQLVASTDATIEDVHFRRPWLTPIEIGARAAAAALSDLAAMAAEPRGLLVAVGLPPDWRGELDELARGIASTASEVGCPIVGGNISLAPALSLTLTVLGSSRAPLHRSGALPGDIIFVTGRLGGSGAALDALLAGAVPANEHRARFAAPRPRIREARWLAAAGARAAIDISDGLLADAAHLAAASNVSIMIDRARLPLVPGTDGDRALTSGEEYELLVAIPPSARVDVQEFMARFSIPLTEIGAVIAKRDQRVISGEFESAQGGHDHLAG